VGLRNHLSRVTRCAGSAPPYRVTVSINICWCPRAGCKKTIERKRKAKKETPKEKRSGHCIAHLWFFYEFLVSDLIRGKKRGDKKKQLDVSRRGSSVSLGIFPWPVWLPEPSHSRAAPSVAVSVRRAPRDTLRP
jgi:hypothetical protein